jgi:proline iminopeptidase
MPVVIVQGRHDHVCPPVSAERLAAVLPSAQLIVTEAGHAASEPATAKALRAATDKLLVSH